MVRHAILKDGNTQKIWENENEVEEFFHGGTLEEKYELQIVWGLDEQMIEELLSSGSTKNGEMTLKYCDCGNWLSHRQT